ncbi:MAG: TRAP transporter small permease [Desulfobacteraceae bacterium]|nr:TRAP transporter small permease [Desulfobacteraceae bacterium]
MMIKVFAKRFRSFNVLLAYIGSYVLFGMMLLTICDVIGRYIFNLPITGAYEITEAMMVTLVFFFIGYTQATKGHVAVDLVVNLLPQKIRVVIDIITHLLSFVMILLVGWMSIIRWLELIRIKEYTPILHIPVSPFLLILALGCFVFCIELGKDMIKFIKNGES